MFIELTESQAGERIALNVNNITSIFDARDKTYIVLDGDDHITVNEGYDLVMQKITNTK